MLHQIPSRTLEVGELSAQTVALLSSALQGPSNSRPLKTATLTTFRINTCKSVSKQRTLTGSVDILVVVGVSARHMRHVTPPSAVPSVDCACFPSPRGCTTTPLPPAEVRRAFASLPRQALTFQDLAASFASLCALLSTLVLCFQSFAASFPKTPGWGRPRLHQSPLHYRLTRP